MWYMTEERELMRNVAREFVEQEVKPVALELDKNDEFPLQLLKEPANWILGLLSGGMAAGRRLDNSGLVTEEISKVAPTLQ